MSKLTEAIEAKLAADGISATAAAKAVGLSLPSFRAVMKGKSTPNARGAKKYAQLLGVSVEDVLSMVDGASTPRKAKGKPGRKPGPKAKGKPGRKPGPKAKGKPGRKPGPKAKGKPGRKPGRKPGAAVKVGGLSGAIALLNQAEAILGDKLAIAVHGLSKGQRATIEMIVANLG